MMFNKIKNLISNNKKYTVIIVICGIVLLSIFTDTGYITSFNKNIVTGFHKIARQNNFSITDISVKGRINTPRALLLQATGLKQSQSIFQTDIDKIKTQVEQLGWVKSAIIERRFPNQIFMTIKERIPKAIWQLDGVLRLIDEDGVIITKNNISNFSNLKVLVGKSANKKALNFMRLIAGDSILAKITTAGVLVSNRRWNVILLGRIEVKLPAKNADKAWIKLANLAKKKKLLTHNIKTIDMRIPNKIFIRINKSKKKKKKGNKA